MKVKTMTELKHTPAPWELSLTGKNQNGIPSDNHFVHDNLKQIAEINDYTIEGEANARLIAAAPELLEALERIVTDQDFFDLEDAPQYILSAIKKAGGNYD